MQSPSGEAVAVELGARSSQSPRRPSLPPRRPRRSYAADISTLEINPATAQLEEHETDVPDSPSSSNAPKVAPGHDGNKLAKSNPGFTGWAGLNFVDQRTADGGNQFSLEPPDQALCVGNGRVLEAVNTVMAMYTTPARR